MILALLFTILFAISGISVSEVVFKKHPFFNRIWLGLTVGLLEMTWLPSLFAFLTGFTIKAQILSATVSSLAALISLAIILLRRRNGERNAYDLRRDRYALFLLLPIILLCVVLLHTHILNRHQDGSLWVGQVTYGDLAMHLGFITSIAEQSVFPPQYSIFPGHALNYPFLCETSGASLFQIGASVRDAYLITAMYAAILTVIGVYLFYKQWLKRNTRAAFATILFFFGGGFGFFYFFDLSKSGGLISTLMSTGGQTVSQTLLDGFYQTPTNIPALGLRWVNPIVDMMIPQRATLFGWAFLFPCLYLLHGFTFEKRRENIIPLAVIAGLLPMIHTHSFLALGVISAVYCVSDLIAVRFDRARLYRWLMYAGITCVLAAPQLFLFTFRQTSESSMVRFHLNWGNETDSFLWFYIKNLGLIFLLTPFALLLLSKRDRRIYAGALFLWILAELIEFQPNDYDNNKLLFIWYAFTCGLVSKFLFVLKHRIDVRIRWIRRHRSIQYSYGVCIGIILSALILYFFFKGIFDAKEGIQIRPGTWLTLLFSSGLLLSICIGAWRNAKKDLLQTVSLPLPTVCSVWLILSLLHIWLNQYTAKAYVISRWYITLTSVLCVCGLVILIGCMIIKRGNLKKYRFYGLPVAAAIVSFLIVFVMTVSSVMTIAREWRSEYQVYTASETELADQIREVTEPDSVILANSYHWNAVTPLTGRSIVTGTSTFLYFHGIDTSEREAHVRMMYTDPAHHEDLFALYGVKYVLLSNAERGYDVDYSYFDTHADVVASTSGGMLLRLHP